MLLDDAVIELPRKIIHVDFHFRRRDDGGLELFLEKRRGLIGRWSRRVEDRMNVGVNDEDQEKGSKYGFLKDRGFSRHV